MLYKKNKCLMKGKIMINENFEKYTQELDDKCRQNDSHGFMSFVGKPRYGFKIIDLIDEVDKNLNYQKVEPENSLKINEEQTKFYVQKFFERYMPEKSAEAIKILNQTHPLFLDDKGNSHIKFLKSEKNLGSAVSHHGNNNFLEFQVSLNGTNHDMITTAHEIGHALSAHHQNKVKKIRQNQKFETFHGEKRFDSDCIGEIESLIIERLFIEFLKEENVISKKESKNYKIEEENSLLSETNQIREEFEILNNLSCPINPQSLKTLIDNLENNNNKILEQRIKTMHDDQRHASYKFRYVVGRIVADTFIKEFQKANKAERQKMLENFQSYLDNTNTLNLDTSCKFLLNKDFSYVCKSYIKEQKRENLNRNVKNVFTSILPNKHNNKNELQIQKK